MPLLLLPPAACTTAATAPVSLSFSRPRPPRARWSSLSFAFPRLRKYGRRHREPVAAPSLDGDDDDEEETGAGEWESDDGEEETEVDEEEFLATRPKPAGFGEGKTYPTDMEEQLLREMGFGGGGVGGGARRRGEAAPANCRAGDSSTKVTATGLLRYTLIKLCHLARFRSQSVAVSSIKAAQLNLQKLPVVRQPLNQC